MAPSDPTKRRGILGTRMEDCNGGRDVLYLRMMEDEWALAGEAKPWLGATNDDEDLVMTLRSAERRAERRAKRAARRIGEVVVSVGPKTGTLTED